MFQQNKPLRLQVFLSHSGICSRRKAMELIQKGHVKVNGLVVKEPSCPVDSEKDKVEANGQRVGQMAYQYVLLNKPRGYVVTTASFPGEKSVLQLLSEDLKHLKPVGRLDKETEGLLLFTNDGDTAYRLTHPKFDVDKTYEVKIKGELKSDAKVRLEKGIRLDGEMTAPARIRDLKTVSGKSEFTMTIHEGRKRQIRLMLEAVGQKVTHLKRIAQGPLKLGDLKPGIFRMLTPQEIKLSRAS